MNKMKKTVCFLLLFALILSLCACGEVSPAPAESAAPSETPAPVESAEPSETPAPVESETPVIPEDIVITAYENSGDYTDSLGNKYRYSYRIPAINADTEDALRLNSLINEQLMSVVNEELSAMADGVSLVTVNVDFSFYVNGGIVSLLCKADSPNDFYSYWVYNYDAESGREFTRSDFLAREELTEEELVSLALSACEAKFIEAFGSFPHDSFYEEQYARTIDPAGYGEDLMLYYGENGALSIVAPIYSLAGAAFYYQELAIR